MTIHLYTLCWNEMDILPFVVDYWKRFVTHAWVYDNGSTDGSVEYLKQFDWITVEHYESNGMDDSKLRDIKNTKWKQSKGNADWVVVCDMDEIVYSKDLGKVLEKASSNGYTAIDCDWYWFCDDYLPEYKDDGLLLHQKLTKFHNNPGKHLIFNPNEINDINYSIGAHAANPTGNYRPCKSDEVCVFHTNKGFGIEYKIRRYKEMNDRLSELDRRNKWSIHYGFSKQTLIDDYLKCQQNSFNVNDKEGFN